MLILKRKCLDGASRVCCGESGASSTIICTRWSSRCYKLGCDAPVLQATAVRKFEMSLLRWNRKKVTWHTKLRSKRDKICYLCPLPHSFILQSPRNNYVCSDIANTPQLQSSWRWPLWRYMSQQDVSTGHGRCHGDEPWTLRKDVIV